jgi:transposase-like protein
MSSIGQLSQFGEARRYGWSGWESWTFEITTGIVGGGRPAVTAVAVTAPEGEAVTAARFKKIPVALLIRLAVSPAPHVAGAAAHVAPDPAALRARAYSTEHLCAVAAVYRFALSQGVAPRDVIAAHFDVSTKTVDRWLRRARERGVLGGYAEERAEHELTPKRWRAGHEPMPEHELALQQWAARARKGRNSR